MVESNNDKKTVTSKIWDMANELRGNMDANEFKNYILAFMFYRFLSEQQEEYLLSSALIEPKNDETVNNLYKQIAESEADLDDYKKDIAKMLGYVINPNDTWTSIIERIDNNDNRPDDFQKIFDNFNDNVKINPNSFNDFKGVFNDVNLGDSRLGSTTATRVKSLVSVIKLVDDIDYRDENGHDILGEIYEFLIGKFAASAGKKGGEFYTPHSVSVILAKLVTNNVDKNIEQFTLYDPTMGSGSLLLTVEDQLPQKNKKGLVSFFGQELNTTTYNLARMNLMMNGVDYQNMKLSNSDTLGNDWPDGDDRSGTNKPRFFDAVVANPPYSALWNNDSNKLKDPRFSDYGKLAPHTKADYAFVLHGLYHLNDTGTMAIVLPHGVLFRGSAESTIRQTIIEKNYLDAVIGLPANLFYGTSIPTTILVLKKNRKNKDVLFIDASKEFEKGKNQNTLTEENIDKIIKSFDEWKDIDKFAHLASFDEIKENDFNLNIPRYVDTYEEEDPIDVGELSKEFKENDAEIKKLEKDILKDLNDLVGSDKENQKVIDLLKDLFK